MIQDALKLALDALENHTAIKHPQQIHYRDKAITAIKEALAQEQEPVAIVTGDAWETDIRFLPEGMALPPDTKLYTHPPQRTEGRVCCQQYDICLEPCTSRGRHLAQLEQEYDNSAVHLAHCYQGEYPVCKYGDENCPAIPKVKAQQEQQPLTSQDIAALVEGMEVSIDVSTSDHDSQDRLFGTVTLVQENQGSKHGLILLVQEPEANFKAPAAQPQRTEQEPVGWMRPSEEGYDSAFRDHRTVTSCTEGNWVGWTPLYTHPPQRTEPPDWFPAVENILKEYGLQAMDFVADFKEAMKDAEQSQRTWVGLSDDDWKEIEDMPDTFDQGVAWAQAKLKEKNG